MAKTEKDPVQKISALTAKALQRGEKLERTLTKLVTRSGPGSAAAEFLKALQTGLKTIRENAKSVEHNASAPSKRTQKDKPSKSGKKPETKAKPRKPATADINPPSEVDARE